MKKYKYPHENYDEAINTVISQCKMWTDNMDSVPAQTAVYDFTAPEVQRVAEPKRE